MRDFFNGIIKVLFTLSVIAGLWMMMLDWRFWVVTMSSLILLVIISSVTSMQWGAVSAEKSQKPVTKDRP